MSSRSVSKILLPLLLAVGAIALNVTADEVQTTVELGPMLGYAGAEEAHIWIKASASAKAGAIVGEGTELREARSVAGPVLEAEPKVIDSLIVFDPSAVLRTAAIAPDCPPSESVERRGCL